MTEQPEARAPRENLKRAAIRGASWQTLASVSTALLSVLQVGIMARHLSPADFGDLALVMIVVSFSKLFIDMGLSNAILHKQDASSEQLSTLYWLNFCFGALVFALMAASAPFVAAWFGRPGLSRLLLISAAIFLILPPGLQFQLILRRELQFGRIALAEMLITLANFLAILFFLLQGYGVLSIIFAMLFSNMIGTLLFLYWGLAHHRPSLCFRLAEIRVFLRFGLYQAGERFLSFLGSHLDQILIGKILGVEALGIYSLAWRIAQIPIQRFNGIFNQVTLPVLSRLQQERERFDYYYRRGIQLLMTMHIPVYLGIALTAPDFILLYLGIGWEAVILPLRILCLYGLLKAWINPVGNVFFSLGRVKLSFAISLLWLLGTASAYFFALQYQPGVNEFAALQVLLVLSLGSIWHFAAARFCHIRYLLMMGSLLRTLLAGILMSLPVYVSGLYLAAGTLRFSIMVFVGVMAYALALRHIDRESWNFFLRDWWRERRLPAD